MPRLPLIMTLGLLAMSCGTAGALTPLGVDEVERALGAPTGELEASDARGLVYAAYNARTLLDIVVVGAALLPGLSRSPLFDRSSLDGCTEDTPRGVEIDMPCLGHHTGKLVLQAQGELANDNGAYELTVARASLRPDIIVDGSFPMRVEGIANPVAVEKTTLTPTAVFDGMPRFFDTLERAGIVVDNTRGSEALYYVVAVLDATFVVQVDEASSTTDVFEYQVQDAKNLWTCRSSVRANEILESECRTPVGQGDFAELRF